MKKPSVIVLKKHVFFRLHPKLNKEAIKLRDGYRCMYCGNYFSKNSLTVDHIIPKSKGGKHTFDNLVCSCKPCNHKKGDNEKIKPKYGKPFTPDYFFLAKQQFKTQIIQYPEWEQFVPKNILPSKKLI
jgi:5-methylcytosine-specific restriction endonuclease McrA